MNFKKMILLLKQLIPLVILQLFWQDIVALVVSNAVKVSQENLFKLTIILFITIIIFLTVYDFVIILLYREASHYLSNIGRWAKKKKKGEYCTSHN